ncbi:Na(+)-translocating NADH-quinone reductase subunit A [Bacteriovorax sp. DB6_IX]|uniref:Na(+)-translocating NADH-quinone reductase subunit A n=1 Tax=Bacteriovorax sp. DB6_IX TaxID=1353530 RepID=UPI00038A1245|nr:Na(+)-translocating NADH-quinone reductase subunit A [Bacteriovorax sp. DB6_IX]EQC52276.1 NADH:ubiquinone oxidoreductase, Na(+)-translocating, A subunit [Bacteriovorax sp. DB6_IX]
MTHIKKGLDLPINGKPAQKIEAGPQVTKVALTGPDYVGMKPTMLVKVGDTVKIGQPLFSCKKVEGVVYTAPANGKVIEINRGERRVFQSIVIEVTGNEQVEFSNYSGKSVKDLSKEDVQNLLVESGLWAALRTRPFSKAPALGSEPKSIFITAMDTNPLAADPQVVIGESVEDFKDGAEIISKLTDGRTYLCKAAGSNVPAPSTTKVETKEFAGVHPAGLPGTHIHFVDPVHANKTVWHIGYQDVIAIGKLFKTGKLSLERVVSIAGPKAVNPTLVRTVRGAALGEVTSGKVGSGEVRVVSGSVLSGRKMEGPFAFLGAFHNQISLLEEDRERELLGWHAPGLRKFSLKRTFLHWLIPGQTFDLTTKLHGSFRAMVPIGSYEKVMPLDILPTQLLRALVTSDTDYAQELGCLELDEEDLALCTFASPGKVDFGPALRNVLTTIEKEG